ncbi:MAG: hypothetical protein ACHQ9S_19030 [Candidatus Binatia bacterium]
MSTAIGKHLGDQIKHDFDYLLGRGRTAFPCPLGQEGRRKFWHNLFRPDIVAAFELLESEEFGTHHLTQRCGRIVTQLDDKQYHVTFHTDDSDLLRFPHLRSDEPFHIGGMVLRDHFPGNRVEWDDFTQWVRNCSQIEREFEGASKAFAEVVKMCGTVGQLVRAVPELRTHLPGRAAESLSDASRASNMPFEWALYDRDKIANIQMCVCKAFLFPARDATSWNGYDETWAKDCDAATN